jgi:hypothetical protein
LSRSESASTPLACSTICRAGRGEKAAAAKAAATSTELPASAMAELMQAGVAVRLAAAGSAVLPERLNRRTYILPVRCTSQLLIMRPSPPEPPVMATDGMLRGLAASGASPETTTFPTCVACNGMRVT